MKPKIKIPVLHIMNRKNGYIGSIEIKPENFVTHPIAVQHYLDNPELYPHTLVSLEFHEYEKETPTA